jgi:hypothetical protein
VTDLLERDAVKYWSTLLADSFTIEREVTTADPGPRLRMDMLLHPKFDWPSGGRHPIGFEIKRPSEARSIGGFTKSIAQASDYARRVWHTDYRPGKPVQVYVAVIDDYTQRSGEIGGFADRITGRLNVALVRRHKLWDDTFCTYLQTVGISTSGEPRWRLGRGPSGAPFSAIPKVGAR